MGEEERVREGPRKNQKGRWEGAVLCVGSDREMLKIH